jgi:phosphoglycolate phosphatase
MNIIFDLDGTLIDSRTRLYSLFCHLVPDVSLSFENYWQFKRSGIGHEHLLGLLNKNEAGYFESFHKSWMELIESDEYLQLDKPFDGVEILLKSLTQNKCKLFLLTARQFPEKVYMQLQRFGWADYFCEVMVTGQKVTKKDMLKRLNIQFSSTVMVGDTGSDIANSNEMGAYSIGVLSGFHSEETLVKYNPNAVVGSVTDINVQNPMGI